MLTDDFFSYLSLELNYSHLTVSAYKRDLEQFIEWLSPGDNNFDPISVTSNDIRAWIMFMSREGLMPKSVRRKVQSIRAFYRFLLKKEIISANPASGLTLPKLPKPLPDFVRTTEMEQVITSQYEKIDLTVSKENENNLRNLLILELFYTLGIRRAELISLNDNDIDFFSKEIKITGKRSKQRIVPIAESLLNLIRRWQKLRDSLWPKQSEDSPLITVKGKRISPSQVYSAVKRELSATNARKKSPHILRHTFASTMLNEGASLNSVKEFLGHASLSTTQIYTHLSLNELKKTYISSHPRAKKEKSD